jgi:hypothetical protein
MPLVVQNWNNYFFMSSLSNGRFLFFLTQSGVGRFDYGAANSGPATPEGVFQARQEYDVVLRWSINTGKQAIFVNGIKYEQDLPNGVADDFPAQISTVDNYATVIKELCFFKRYPSDDEIRTWHSLDAPFYDPREQIDSAGRPVHGAGWEADQNGLRSNVVTETGRRSFEITTDGNAYFGGELRAGIVVDESISNNSTIAKLYSAGRISMPIGLWSDNTYGYDVLLPDVIDFDQLGVVVNCLTWAGISGLIDGVWKIPADFPMYTYNLNTGVYTRVPTQMVESAVVLNVCPQAWWRQASGDRVRLEAAVTYLVVANGQTLPWYSIRTPFAADAGVHNVDYFIAIKQHWG